MTRANAPLAALTLDETTRPTMPPLPEATDEHRAKGRHLALIHRHYLQDLSKIAAVLKRIEQGEDAADDLYQIVLNADMAQNFRAFGNLCGQECQILKMHHDIEQSHMFPGLEAAGHTALTAIVARLRQEHEVVHALLLKLQEAALALSEDANESTFAHGAEVFRRLDQVVRSHFKYEETQLEEAIGVYLDGI